MLEKTTDGIEEACLPIAGCGSEGVIVRATALVRSPHWQQSMGQWYGEAALWIVGSLDVGVDFASAAAPSATS